MSIKSASDRNDSTPRLFDRTFVGSFFRIVYYELPNQLKPVWRTVYFTIFVIAFAYLNVFLYSLLDEPKTIDWSLLSSLTLSALSATLAYGIAREYFDQSRFGSSLILGLLSSVCFWGTIAIFIINKRGASVLFTTEYILILLSVSIIFGVGSGVYLWADRKKAMKST